MPMNTMIFISQPMKGLKDEEIASIQKELFDKIASEYDNPILINPYRRKSEQLSITDFAGNTDVNLLGQAITQMSYADVVVFAKGWEQFRGCRIEQKVCTYYDIPMKYA